MVFQKSLLCYSYKHEQIFMCIELKVTLCHKKYINSIFPNTEKENKAVSSRNILAGCVTQMNLT